jgi:3-isopropylmalate dehydrogenase
MMASDTKCCAQAQHGSAPDLQSQDKANPVSMILSVAMLIDWTGEKRRDPTFGRAAAAIDAAVDQVLANPASRTADLGGICGTKDFAVKVAAAIAAP